MSKRRKRSKTPAAASTSSPVLPEEIAKKALNLPSSAATPRSGGPMVHGVVHQEMTQHRGPLPSPETFDAYNKTLPGAAERILAMAEKSQSHRHEMEKMHLQLSGQMVARGQWFALLLGLTGLCWGGALLLANKRIEGFSLVIGTVATLVTAFLYGEKQKRQAKEQTDDTHQAS